MLNSATCLLLIATLVGCPFWCLSGDSCCAPGVSDAGQAAACACCCERWHRQAAAPGEASRDGSQPAKNRPEKERCQCICGGAVMQKSATSGLCEVSKANTQVSAVAGALVASPVTPTVSWHPPASAGGTNPGRLARIQFASLLC